MTQIVRADNLQNQGVLDTDDIFSCDLLIRRLHLIQILIDRVRTAYLLIGETAHGCFLAQPAEQTDVLLFLFGTKLILPRVVTAGKEHAYRRQLMFTEQRVYISV